MGFKHAKRKARQEGGSCMLCNLNDYRKWRGAELRAAGLVSVKGQENILRWTGVTRAQLCDMWDVAGGFSIGRTVFRVW